MRILMSRASEELQLRVPGGPSPLASWSDEKLLLSYCSERDSTVFAELVRRYEKELFGYLRHYLGNAEMAEDVFQQTFLQVHLKCDQFEAGRKVCPWLYTVATNQAIDYRRRNRRHRVSSLSRGAEHNSEEEAGAGRVARRSGNGSGRQRRIGRAIRCSSPGDRRPGRAIEAGSDARVLSRIEVP